MPAFQERYTILQRLITLCNSNEDNIFYAAFNKKYQLPTINTSNSIFRNLSWAIIESQKYTYIHSITLTKHCYFTCTS
jgi:ABC-type uncharacterized transport system ATPase subunit